MPAMPPTTPPMTCLSWGVRFTLFEPDEPETAVDVGCELVVSTLKLLPSVTCAWWWWVLEEVGREEEEEEEVVDEIKSDVVECELKV